jgi:hypothetical protein
MHGLRAGGVFARGWLGFARKPYAIGQLARQDGHGKAKTVTARLPVFVTFRAVIFCIYHFAKDEKISLIGCFHGIIESSSLLTPFHAYIKFVALFK